jgi:hypothetical protein
MILIIFSLSNLLCLSTLSRLQHLTPHRYHLMLALLSSCTYSLTFINSRSLSGLSYRKCSFSGPIQPNSTFCATRMNFLTRSGPLNFNYFYFSLSVYALYPMLSLTSSVITKFNGYSPSNYLKL